MNKQLLKIWMLSLSMPGVILGGIDYEGMLQGQAVMISEARSNEFQNPPRVAVPLPYLRVSGSASEGKLEWRFHDYHFLRAQPDHVPKPPGFVSLQPDKGGRSVPTGPVFDPLRPNDTVNYYGGASGRVVLIPHDKLPPGKWIVSAKLYYNVIPGGNPDSVVGHLPSAELLVQCWSKVRHARGTSHRRRVFARAEKYFNYTGGNWSDQELSAISDDQDALQKCKDFVDREGNQAAYVRVSFSVNYFQKFQFNGIRVLLTKVIND